MTTLTPQQRIAAYEWAAERIHYDRYAERFICIELRDWVDRRERKRLFRRTKETNHFFPELMTFLEGEEYAPLDCLAEDRQARLFILGSCRSGL